MKKVEIKIVRDDNKEFLIDHTIWGIPSDGLTGFDSVDNEVYTENYYSGDGSRETGMRISEKDRTIKARLMDASLNEVQRDLVISFFNPKHRYSVYVTYQGRTRWFEGRQIGFSCPNENVYKPITITWSTLSTMPFMLSTENYGENIGEIIPVFGYPMQSISGYGFNVGIFKFAKQVKIENDGEFETYFRCVISANGTVINPKITKGDKYVRLLDTLHSGDTYEINFENIPPTIRKNGENASRYLDKTSSLADMTIPVGGDIFGFDADNGSEQMDVTIYRYKRYQGI